MSRRLAVALLAGAALATTGCVKKIAVNSLADAMSGDTGGAFTRDDDLQFVGEAIPFGLKLMESLHEQSPEHMGLLESLASGFTQYATVYIKWPAEQVKYDDYPLYLLETARAARMYDRALDYGMEGLEVRHPGFRERMVSERDDLLAEMTEEDIPLLYWTAAAWLSKISLSKGDMFAIGQLPQAASLVQRALALDETWGKGAIHDLMIVLEPSLPMPGGMERAREHYQRAVELSGGTLASPHVSLATTVSIAEQDRDEFVALLEEALAVDPEASPDDILANLYAQEQARFYLDHIDDLFVE